MQLHVWVSGCRASFFMWPNSQSDHFLRLLTFLTPVSFSFIRICVTPFASRCLRKKCFKFAFIVADILDPNTNAIMRKSLYSNSLGSQRSLCLSDNRHQIQWIECIAMDWQFIIRCAMSSFIFSDGNDHNVKFQLRSVESPLLCRYDQLR